MFHFVPASVLWSASVVPVSLPSSDSSEANVVLWLLESSMVPSEATGVDAVSLPHEVNRPHSDSENNNK